MNTNVSSEQTSQPAQMEILNNIIRAVANPDLPISAEELIQIGLSQESVNQFFTVRDVLHQYQVNQQVAAQVAAQQQKTHMEISYKETFDTISQIKKGLNDSISSSRRIQTSTAIMYLSTFFLGFALVIAGAFFPNSGQGADWFTLTFGASGFVLILATLVSKPPRELQRVRSNYVQLSILALGWFNEFLDNSGIRVQVLHNKEVVDSEILSLFQDLVNLQNKTTHKYMSMMERFAEPESKDDNKALDDILSKHVNTPSANHEPKLVEAT